MDPRQTLTQIAKDTRDLPARRGQAIQDARDAGITWREIGTLLGITENGVHKAYDAWKRTQA